MLDSITDEQLSAMSIGQVEELFNSAKFIGLQKEVVDEFWSRFSKLKTEASLQHCLEYLEAYKRNIGATYNRLKGKIYAAKYNDLEDNIAWLAKTYNLQRTTKPYYIKENKNDTIRN